LVGKGKPSGFTPALQDRFAVAKIEERGALGLIRKEKIGEAITGTTQANAWLSSSGGVHARKGKALEDVISRHEEILKEYLKK
jgi:muramidase (phage lysozyme)